MPAIQIDPSLASVVAFDDAGVRLPRRRRRRGGGKRQRLRRFAGETTRDEVWFLRHATFEVAAGESLAVVGYRGSGRDEILRLSAGVIRPDEGAVRRSLRVIPMVGVRSALNKQYTVRQNIFLVGGLLGMTKAELIERVPEVSAAAGVESMLDKYLGEAPAAIRGRLAWAIAMGTRARAFAIAQGLVVGDLRFQKECWATVEAMRADGVTFLVSSDKPSELERFCDRAILIDKGEVLAQTTVADALERLKQLKPPTDQVHFAEDDLADDDDDFLL